MAAALAFAGCGKQLATISDLAELQRRIVSEYGEDGVNVNLSSGALTVTFINSPLNFKNYDERAKRAQATAVFVKRHYPSITKVDELWVVFLRQETRYIVVTYTDSVGSFGFDRNARPLQLSEDVKPVRNDNPGLHPTAVYSAARDRTEISISRLQLEGNLNNGLALVPHFEVAGDSSGVRQSAAAPKFVSLDFAAFSFGSMFPGPSRIIFLSDEKVVYDTTDKFSGSTTAKGGVSEYLLLQVPYPAFRRMVAGEKLTLRMGDREYQLSREQLAALREMTAYVKT
ncbi:MAG: hypothetical protein ABJC10_14710 [Acidobacteriota bacterium]